MLIRSNYPDYLRDFVCKCGACRRTCCRHDWNVVMTEKEYRAAFDEALGSEAHAVAAAHIKPNPRSTGPGDYAFVEMVGDVDCPLLDGEGLCVWMRLTGRHLCSTCNSFPCTVMAYRGQEYLMPSGGCEAVLEALLHRTAPVRMLSEDREAVERNYYVHITEDLVTQRPLLGHYPRLVQFGLDVLQDRSRSLDERVACLLEGLARVDRMEDEGELGRLPAFLKEFEGGVVGGTGARDGVPVGADGSAAWLMVFVCGEMFAHYCHSSAHAPTALRILEGLGVAVREVRGARGAFHCLPQLRSTEDYPAKHAALSEFFERRSVFLEHVAVSLYLKMLLPVREPGVWTHAMYFAAVYAAVKGGLTGYFAPAEPEDESLVDVLVEILRMATHSELMYPTICRRLKAARLDNLQAMQALVRA